MKHCFGIRDARLQGLKRRPTIEKTFSEQRKEDRDSQRKKIHTVLGIVYSRSTNSPGTHTSIAIGECEIRQLRRWQWARVPPAATPTRIYLIFPFYLFGLPLVQDHSSNPHSSVAIIGEHGGLPPAMARRPSSSLAGYYSSSADAWCASRLRAHRIDPNALRNATMRPFDSRT